MVSVGKAVAIGQAADDGEAKEAGGGITAPPYITHGEALARLGSIVLHVDIGLATKFYCQMLTGKLQELDDEILSHTQGFSSRSNGLHLEVLSLRLQIATVEDKKGKMQRQIMCKEEEKDAMPTVHQHDNSEEAREERKEQATLSKEIRELKKEVKSAESELVQLKVQLDATDEAASKEDGPIMKELRCYERCLNLQITAYHGGALNGPDAERVFAMKPFPVQYKLSGAVCPVCNKDFASHVGPSKDPNAAAKAMLQHLLDAHEGEDAHMQSTKQCAKVPRVVQW